MKRKAGSIYVDSHGFDFCYNAKKLMEENRLKFGCKYYRGKKIEGGAK